MSGADGRGSRLAGRYAIEDEIAAGGMASVHFGVLVGPLGFSRIVAVKKLHPQFARDPEFVAMFLDEARLASRIRHPNVVATLDVVEEDAEVVLVMEYVAGEPVSKLLRTAAGRDGIPVEIAVAIASGMLQGLHAAHEAKDDRGELLDLVHRDVSPQNVLVGVDGITRVVDFGVAKATGRSHTTREGQLKGKMPYMAPEQLRSGQVTRRTDIWSASVVLWEMLVGRRLFEGDSEGHIYSRILNERAPAPSARGAKSSRELDEIVLRGLSRAPERRFADAREMTLALERCVRPATPAGVGAWVEAAAHDVLTARAEQLRRIETERRADTAGAAAPVPAHTPATQPTEASIPPPVHETRRRGALWTPAVVLAVLVGIGILAASSWLREEPPGALLIGRLAAFQTVGEQVARSALAEEPAVPAPAASDAPGEPAEVRAPTARSRPAGRPSRPGSTAPAPARGERCHTLDASGVWHIRPECL